MRSPDLSGISIVCAFAVLAALLGAGFGHPLQNMNEGLYARVAQEMLDARQWIVPMLDGVPYLEKPPLLYWITAAAFAVAGAGEVAARTAPWLGAVLALSALAWFARRHYGGRVALFAALILASSPLFVGLARTLLFDMLFTGLLAWALVLAHEAIAARPRRGFVRAAYAVLALAVLAKGLAAIAFACGTLLVAVALAARGERAWRLRVLLDPAALLLFAAIAVPWHVAAWLREPSFGWFYFWNEHIGRLTDSRWPHDYYTGPPWYYLPRIVGHAFPWILLLAWPVRVEARGAGALRGFAWAWFLVPLAVFSLAASKSEYYMIVGLPPLALILARRLEALRQSRSIAVLPLAAAAGMAGLIAVTLRAPHAVMPPDAPRLLAAGLAVVVAASVAFGLKRVRAGAIALSAFGVVLALLYSGFMESNESQRSARSLARVIRVLQAQQVYVYRDFEGVSALPFYLRRPVGVVDSRSRDLLYGIRLKPDARRFPAVVTFLDAVERGESALLVVPASRLQAFRASPLAWQFDYMGHVGPFELFRHPGPERIAVRAFIVRP
jgi:4-amino-4-deoxy-L-arabinose transferase-like glycosyltransferase